MITKIAIAVIGLCLIFIALIWRTQKHKNEIKSLFMCVNYQAELIESMQNDIIDLEEEVKKLKEKK